MSKETEFVRGTCTVRKTDDTSGRILSRFATVLVRLWASGKKCIIILCAGDNGCI